MLKLSNSRRKRVPAVFFGASPMIFSTGLRDQFRGSATLVPFADELLDPRLKIGLGLEVIDAENASAGKSRTIAPPGSSRSSGPGAKWKSKRDVPPTVCGPACDG